MVYQFRAPQQISMGFASCLCYCGDVAHWRPAKLCTMFGHLIGWYTISRFSVVLAPWCNFALCILHFTSKSCILLYWQCYCTALQQRAWAKLCSVVQWMELRNFCRGRHLYSAGRPSRWALFHILVLYYSLYVYVCFVVLDLVFSVLCQEIGWEERLWNDLFVLREM